jgi:nitric oxide reductase large subunit
MLLFIACGAGIYLGLHFNILVLLPFSILGAGAFIVSSWSSEQNLFDSAGTLLVSLVSLQAGFMLGLTARGSYGQLLARLNIGQSKRI